MRDAVWESTRGEGERKRRRLCNEERGRREGGRRREREGGDYGPA